MISPEWATIPGATSIPVQSDHFGMTRLEREECQQFQDLYTLLKKDLSVRVGEEVLSQYWNETAKQHSGMEIDNVTKVAKQLLLDQQAGHLPITQAIFGLTVGNEDDGIRSTKWLLEEFGDRITDEDFLGLFKVAAGNETQGKPILESLLARHKGPFAIKEDIVEIASGNEKSGLQILKLLDTRGEGPIPVTQEAVEAAARIEHDGLERLEILLKQRGSPVAITNKIIEVATGNKSTRVEMLALLLEKGKIEFSLAWALEKGFDDVAQLLLDSGKVDENIQDKNDSRISVNVVRRWALLCGGDWYAPGTARPKKPKNLRGCVRDVNVMKELLLKSNDPDLKIRTLTATTRQDADQPLESADRWPTWENIRRELRSIEDEANADAGHHDRLLYFHYSGHGTIRTKVAPNLPREEDVDENDIPNLDGIALVMSDVTSGGAYLSGRQLGFWVRRMVRESGFRATIVLDSCYSGYGLRDHDNDTGTPRTLDYVDDSRIGVDYRPEEDAHEDDLENDGEGPRDSSDFEKCWLSNPKGCAVVTACSKQKTASEKIFDGTSYTQGVLTHWLRDLLSRHRSKPQLWPSHKRIVDYTRTQTRAGQTPMVFGDDLFEFFGLKSYAEGESCNATREKSGLVKIDIGRAQGVVVGAVYDVVPPDTLTIDTVPLPLQIRVISNVGTFESTAELVSQVTTDTWPVGETRDATLRQWALPRDVGVHLATGNVEDTALLSDELVEKPGLVLGSGSPSKRDFVISLDGDHLQILQDGNSLPRLPKISYADPSWPTQLIRVLSHVSRFQALIELYDTWPNNSRLPRDQFNFVSIPDQVKDGEKVNLTLRYDGRMSPLWISLYCFSASWSISKIWPLSGTAAEKTYEPHMFNKNIIMSVPSKWRESDPGRIEDHFYMFVSASSDGQIPSWGNMCLPSLRSAELTDPVEWTKASMENEGDDRDIAYFRDPKSDERNKGCHWTVVKSMVVTEEKSM